LSKELWDIKLPLCSWWSYGFWVMRKSRVSVTLKKSSGLILGPKSDSKSSNVRINFFGSTMSWNQPEKLHVQVQFYNLSQIIGVWTTPLERLRVRLGNVNLTWLWRWTDKTGLNSNEK
jgi:hypothetical protein